ncbi:Membrane-associated tyrosine- and threonine-specific cdc2-inhibitory kinase [Nosema granulosis]|uniref:Membrane-associated tyrosine- and threonine-specific cdc2-inhibitory kinase n=1 Tax=Nosema granulosis TaxID=83296 RepID=A0A9P6H0X8_9MICR|nr:Membrane-associated tyrosine- and threonine-specific cdc2-inhibitory kinase [Nosema granulosis]
MVDKKLFTFKFEKSDTALGPPKTPVKRIPYKDIFNPTTPSSPTTPIPSGLLKIATGDFFEVFVSSNSTAIKKSLGVFRTESERASILKEVEILKKLDSPHIVQYIKDWEIDRHIYIEMEYCSLGTLREFMNLVYFSQKSSFSPSTISKIMKELCLGLQEIHRLNIVHLDLKPENIFLQHSEEDTFILKIGDFNISRYEGEEIGMDGDKKYMAPEVLDNICIRASDVYSLGLIYIEILNGIILPTSGEGWLRLRNNIFTGIKLGRFGRKMLEKDHRKRIEINKLSSYYCK